MEKTEVNNANLKSIVDSLQLDDSASQKLARLLNQTVLGSEVVYMSPLTARMSPEDILSGWDRIYNDKSSDSTMNEELLSLELAQKGKYGPRSIQVPWSERRQTTLDYFKSQAVNVTDLIFPSFGRSHFLRPISLDSALDKLKNSTSSGLPFLLKKGLLKERYATNFEELLNRKDPGVLYTRTQESKKTRNVIGYPMADTIEEYCFFAPILELHKRLPFRSALNGPHAVDVGVTKMILNVKHDSILMSADIELFDVSAQEDLQKPTFGYFKSLYQKQFAPRIDQIYLRFNTIGLVTPDGVMHGSHGVPSGSTFTNECGSVIQSSIVREFVESEDDMQLQGDDGVYLLLIKKVDELKSKFSRSGLNLHPTKSLLSQVSCMYLQKYYHKDYLEDGLIGGIYPVYRALSRIVYQERWSNFEDFEITGVDFYSIRTISILENCKYHPLFKELVKYIYSIDKYSLEYSPEGLAKYIGMLNKADGGTGLLVNQYGDNISGIGDFETVKILKEL
jgi:hypothetical protein